MTREKSHLDSWPGYPGTDTPTSRITHGTFFNIAREEGLLADASSVHAGIRCKFAVNGCCLGYLIAIVDKNIISFEIQGPEDIEHDEQVGFEMITTDDLDDYGIPAIISRIRKRVGNTPVYLR
jgi:agmatinase